MVEHEYTIYRKTIEKITMTEKDGVDSLSTAWKVGKELMGSPLIKPEEYPEDREVRVRWKVIRGEIDPDKE